MRVFAAKPFRYSGIDYPYGWQDLPQTLADTLRSVQLVDNDNVDLSGVQSFNTLAGIPAGFSGSAKVVNGASLINNILLLSTNTAAQNTALIQGALDAANAVGGGKIELFGSGIVLFVPTLVIYSNTTLIANPGFVLKQAPGNSKVLIKNYAQDSAATTVTLTYTSGRYVSVAWANHGLAVGDYCSIAKVLPSSFVGVFPVTTVTDANNFIVMLARIPTSAPVATNYDLTTAGAVILAKKADVNININLTVLDYDVANNPGATGVSAHGSAFGHIVRSNITTMAVNTLKYSAHIGAALDCDLTVKGTNTHSDLVKGYGPLINCRFVVSGSSNDDGISLQTKEPTAYAQFAWTYGDILNCKVSGMLISPVSPFGVYLSPYELLDNVVFEDCSGYATAIGGATFKIWGNISDNIAPITGTIAQSGGTLTGTGTQFLKELHVGQTIYNAGSAIGTVTAIASKTSATVSSPVTTTAGTVVTGSPGRTSGKFGLIKLVNISSKGRDSQGQVAGELLTTAACTGRILNYQGTFEPQATGVSGFSINTNVYIEHLISSTELISDSFVYSGYYHYINGKIDKLTIKDSSADTLGTAGDFVFLDASSYVKEISFNSNKIANFSNIVNVGLSLNRPTINCTNNYFDSNKIVTCSGTLGYNINLTGNVLDNMYNGAVRGGANTWTCNLKSGGNTLLNGSLYAVPLTPANFKIYLYGADITADINNHDKTVAGQLCIASAAAGTIVAGNMVVCDGTNWRQVSNTTLLL